MFAVRHYPTDRMVGLFARLKQDVRYDEDGRYSNYLWINDKPLEMPYAVIAASMCPDIAASAWRSVIIQAYRDGNAVTPCHNDRGHSISFILSLGATRIFRTHHTIETIHGCGDYNLDITNIECINGTVIIMDDDFHKKYHHQIVSDSNLDTGERISLVFRGG